jgi:hypothetical protein
MVLLFNVYLTDSKANQFVVYNRGNLPNSNKLDITKYSLASLAKAYDWDKAIINVELDPACYSEEDKINLKEFVSKEFKRFDVLYSNKRNELQSEWQKTYYEINSNLIFYLGNHDHIFMDSDNSYLKKLVNIANEIEYSTITTSHYPENIRWAKCGYIELDENTPRKFNSNYEVNDDYVSYEGICIDSLNIITKSLYYNWFFTGKWDNVKLPRTDGIGGASLLTIRKALNIPLPQQKILIPYKEQLRHFDGYMHQKIGNNICPSISIPEGFFEGKIKIRYGYDDYKEGWVNINPLNEKYYAEDKQGVDYKFTLEDIPLFWKDKIEKIDTNQNINEELNIQYSLYSVLNMIYSDARYNPYIDEEVKDKALNTYLQTHQKYSLI